MAIDRSNDENKKQRGRLLRPSAYIKWQQHYSINSAHLKIETQDSTASISKIARHGYRTMKADQSV